MIDVTSVAHFDDEVRNGLVLVKFFMPSCGPCATLDEVLRVLAPQYPSIRMLSVNVLRHPIIGKRFGVTTVPTVYILRDGVHVTSFTGCRTSQELDDMLRSLL